MTEQHMRPAQPLVMGPDEGRELPMIGRVAVSGAQTGGAFELIDFRGNVACPPPHIHREREECIQVLEGLFTFTIGTEEVEVAPGSWVYVPRGTRHGFTASADARALILVTPAGLEGFFAELGGGLAAGTPTQELRAALKGRFDSVPA
ncbi:cupin domain-containing protein [Amycolatopsis pithecellobii]|uniref:Cupin domain-containing protein n=1 Tax=Amycolatopsis pithecellobii TaxID=664692 RepID=A0A6N7YLU9_9PSEU|nr:cupin domain-containing protein [Amycolatopsis pithecellobii]MTD52878.1 cupin domain-containing protein [Amycolatopsis pithecellobii]